MSVSKRRVKFGPSLGDERIQLVNKAEAQLGHDFSITDLPVPLADNSDDPLPHYTQELLIIEGCIARLSKTPAVSGREFVNIEVEFINTYDGSIKHR